MVKNANRLSGKVKGKVKVVKNANRSSIVKICALITNLAFGAGDVLAVLKLDLPRGLSEVSKAGPSRPPEHVVGDRLVRRLRQEDRQVAQVAWLVKDHPLSVLNL